MRVQFPNHALHDAVAAALYHPSLPGVGLFLFSAHTFSCPSAEIQRPIIPSPDRDSPRDIHTYSVLVTEAAQYRSLNTYSEWGLARILVFSVQILGDYLPASVAYDRRRGLRSKGHHTWYRHLGATRSDGRDQGSHGQTGAYFPAPDSANNQPPLTTHCVSFFGRILLAQGRRTNGLPNFHDQLNVLACKSAMQSPSLSPPVDSMSCQCTV